MFKIPLQRRQPKSEKQISYRLSKANAWAGIIGGILLPILFSVLTCNTLTKIEGMVDLLKSQDSLQKMQQRINSHLDSLTAGQDSEIARLIDLVASNQSQNKLIQTQVSLQFQDSIQRSYPPSAELEKTLHYACNISREALYKFDEIGNLVDIKLDSAQQVKWVLSKIEPLLDTLHEILQRRSSSNNFLLASNRNLNRIWENLDFEADLLWGNVARLKNDGIHLKDGWLWLLKDDLLHFTSFVLSIYYRNGCDIALIMQNTKIGVLDLVKRHKIVNVMSFYVEDED